MPVPQSLPAGREIRGSLGDVLCERTGCERVSRKKREILTGMSCLETVSIRSSRILMSDYCVLDRRRHQAQAPRLRWPREATGRRPRQRQRQDTTRRHRGVGELRGRHASIRAPWGAPCRWRGWSSWPEGATDRWLELAAAPSAITHPFPRWHDARCPLPKAFFSLHPGR